MSFVDCPGHDVLMTTMLNGTAIMDAAILLVAANEPCPQPQTTEHLFAAEIMDLKSVLIVQNKVDLVSKEQALEQHDQIREFLKTSRIDGPVIPVSGQLKINIDALMDYIVNYIKMPDRAGDKEKSPKMVVIRSFDINRPGTTIQDLKGGVIGGSLVSGVLSDGDKIEIRPGIVYKDNEGLYCTPFITEITGLKAEQTKLKKAYPGGLIGVGTNLDPSFCKSDRLVGMVMGLKGTLPPVYTIVKVKVVLFQKTVSSSKENLRMDESILLNIGSTTTGCKILEINEDEVSFELMKCCCCEIGERICVSRKIKNNWRLIGHGIILGGEEIRIKYN